MTNTISSEGHDVLNHVRRDLSGVEIAGSEIYTLLRVPLYFAIKNKHNVVLWKRYLLFFQQLGRLAKLLGARAISWILAKRLLEITQETLFVIDHHVPKDIEFQSLILSYFDKSKITILTSNPLVKDQLDIIDVGQIYRSDCMANRVRLTWEDYLFSLQVLFCVRRVGMLFLPFLAISIMRSILYVKLYEQVLSSVKTKAVVTYCDAHPHEQAITAVAVKKGISTYTNQHGMIGSLYAPVISDKIFVWGDVSKEELVNLGVNQEKIVVVGRVGLASVHPSAAINELFTTTQLSVKYGFPPHKLTISYFATNWGDHENRELFKAFCHILSLPVNILVRPRPGASNQQIAEYHKWLHTFSEGSTANVVISNEDSMQEVFEGIDVLVTCHSGAIVDAMPYSVVGVVLDLFEYMNLRDTLPHYQDSIVTHDSKSLFSAINGLLIDHDLLIKLKQQAFKSHEKYQANSYDKPVEQVIAEYIINDANLRI